MAASSHLFLALVPAMSLFVDGLGNVRFRRGIGTPKALQCHLDGAPGFEDVGEEPTSRPWLDDPHHPLLGRHVPPGLVPDFPDTLVIPCHQLAKVAPTGFRAYTKRGDNLLVDHGDTWDEARWKVLRMAEL
jgi:hypothetical protein